jgi:beta-lactamase superfamily II metal-dependent hydrolase
MTVHFLDVGEGDATLIESQGHFLLMDGGDRDHSSSVVSYLKKQGISTLDYVIASHFDDDHINGIVGALHVFAVSEMLEPGYAGTTSVYQSLKNIESQKSITPVVPKVGDSCSMGSISFTVVGPTNYSHDEENDNSLCVLVTCGNNRFLFTGDARETTENEICGTGISLSADVLEAGHHGSSTSNSETLLNAVSPTYMVLSCGKDNSYGLPDQNVIERIRDKGISLFRTDEQGTILATSDGTSITWSTEPSTTWAYGSAEGSSESWDSTISYNAVGDTGTSAKYILNTHTMKFHLPGCKYAGKISKKNYAESNESRDQLIAEGYSPCGECNP